LNIRALALLYIPPPEKKEGRHFFLHTDCFAARLDELEWVVYDPTSEKEAQCI
jgi:hypothetical protein